MIPEKAKGRRGPTMVTRYRRKYYKDPKCWLKSCEKWISDEDLLMKFRYVADLDLKPTKKYIRQLKKKKINEQTNKSEIQSSLEIVDVEGLSDKVENLIMKEKESTLVDVVGEAKPNSPIRETKDKVKRKTTQKRRETIKCQGRKRPRNGDSKIKKRGKDLKETKRCEDGKFFHLIFGTGEFAVQNSLKIELAESQGGVQRLVNNENLFGSCLSVKATQDAVAHIEILDTDECEGKTKVEAAKVERWDNEIDWEGFEKRLSDIQRMGLGSSKYNIPSD